MSQESDKKRKREEEPEENKDTKEMKTEKELIKIISLNVNGFNAFLKKGDILKDLVEKEKPIAVCLQETKLNKNEKKYTELLKGYTSHFNYCKKKKGYSGTAVYVSNHFKPLKVTFDMGIQKHDEEGRLITIEYEKFYLINTYIPNSGQKLERLEYRTKEWDPDFFEYLKTLEKTKPIIWTGDLNVSILDIDVHDPKRMKKKAGFTKEEREEFQKVLDYGFIDTFRKFYPNDVGKFSFWGYINNLREKNKGMRLDYFITSKVLDVKDSKILSEIQGSDHCPVMLEFII